MDFLVLALATYYLVIALTRTDGPWGAFYKLRRYQWLPLHCTTCTAFWMAIATCLLSFAGEHFLLTILAVAGIVTLIEDIRLTLLE